MNNEQAITWTIAYFVHKIQWQMNKNSISKLNL